MTAFVAATAALFRDRNMAQDVIWRPAATGVSTTVRGIVSAPDDIVDIAGARIHSNTKVVTVRCAEVPNPRPDDEVQIGADVFTVLGEPMQDTEALTWRLMLSPEGDD